MRKLITLVSIAILTAMATTGCRSLAPGGVYKGDMVLYQYDANITRAKTVIFEFLTWEKEHRAVVPAAAQEAAKTLRVYAPKALSDAVALRDAYVDNPTAENKKAVDKAFDVVDAMLAIALKHFAKGAS